MAAGFGITSRGRNLIVRILKGRVGPGHAAIFREQVRRVVRDAQNRDGLVYAHVGRQAYADAGEEMVFVSVWRDLEAIYSWLGVTDLLQTPMLDDGQRDAFERLELQHYEVLEPDGAATILGEELDTTPTLGGKAGAATVEEPLRPAGVINAAV